MLLKRARIETYLPDNGSELNRRLLAAIENEFVFTFGGCSVIKEIKGLYLSEGEEREYDRIALVYSDMPFELGPHLKQVSAYADAIRESVGEALGEESVLVVVNEVYHSL